MITINERGKKMKHNQQTSQVLMGIIASILSFGTAANATGQAGINAAQDAARAGAFKALAAQEKALKPMVMPKSSPKAALVKDEQPHHGHNAIAGADKIHFKLTDIHFEGNTVLPANKLKKAVAGKIGHEISLAEVYKIAEEVEVVYRKAGYEFVRVLVPAQKSSGGIIKLQVVETVVGKVTFVGDLHGRTGVLESIKAALLASKPLRHADIERYVLLLNDIPGVQASVRLSKSDALNATDLTFTLAPKIVDVSLALDNSKPENLGTTQAVGFLSINNAAGLYEKFSVTGATDFGFKKSRYVRGAVGILLGSEGTYGTISANYSDTAPVAKDVLKNDTTTTGNNKGWALDVSHPFLRSRALNLSVNGTFDYKDSTTKVSTSDAVYTNIRALSGGLTFDMADSTGGVTMVQADVEMGVNFLSATPSQITAAEVAAKTSGKAFSNSYPKVEGTITRLQTFPGVHGFSVQLAVTGQYSMAPLPAMKEFSLGGRDYLRGLDTGIASGDNGFAGKLDVRYSIPQTYVETLQPYAFADYGRVWNRDDKILNDVQDGFVPQTDTDTLSAWSLGFGLKADFSKYLTAYAEVDWLVQQSQALKKAISVPTDAKAGNSLYDQANSGARFFVGVTVRY